MDMLGMQNNQMGRMRYVLKEELKYLPMFGLYFWQVRIWAALSLPASTRCMFELHVICYKAFHL